MHMCLDTINCTEGVSIRSKFYPIRCVTERYDINIIRYDLFIYWAEEFSFMRGVIEVSTRYACILT